MVLTRRGKEGQTPAKGSGQNPSSPFKHPSALSPSRRKVAPGAAAAQDTHTSTPRTSSSPTRNLIDKHSAAKTRLPKSAATMQLRNRPRKEGNVTAARSATALGKRRQGEEHADEWADSDNDKSGTSSPVNEFGRTQAASTATSTPKAQAPVPPRHPSPTNTLTRSRSDKRIFDTALPSMIPSSPSSKALAHKIRRGADISDVHANGKVASNPSPGSTSAIPKFGTFTGQRPKARLSAGIGRNTVTTMARFGLPVRDAKQRGGSAAAGVSPSAPLPPPQSSSSPVADSSTSGVVQFGSMQQRNRRFSFTSQVSKGKNDSEKENRPDGSASNASKSPTNTAAPALSLKEQQSLRKLNRAMGPPQSLHSRYGAQGTGTASTPAPPSSASVKSKAALWEKSTSTPVQQSKRGGTVSASTSTKTQRRLSGNTSSLATKSIPAVAATTASTSPARSPFQHIANPRPAVAKQQQQQQQQRLQAHRTPVAKTEAEETLLASSPGDETFDLRGLALSPTPDSPVVNFKALLGGGADDSLGRDDGMDGSLGSILKRRPVTGDLLKSSSDIDSADLPSLMSSLAMDSSSRVSPSPAADADAAAAIAVSAWISPPPTPAPTAHLESIIESQRAELADLQRRLESTEKRLVSQSASSAEHCAILETALQETEERLAGTEEVQQRLEDSNRAHSEEVKQLQRLLEVSRRDTEVLRADQDRVREETVRTNTRYEKVKGLASQALTHKASMGWEMLLGAAWSEAQVVQEQMETCRLLAHDLDLWERRLRGSGGGGGGELAS